MTDEQLSSLATSLPGFGQLTQYVAQDTDGAGKEKCVAVCLNRLQSVGTAPAEFYNKAMRNPSVDNPVLHLLASWPEHERPTHEQIFDACRDVLKALNLHEHQWLMAIHNDTDNLHCHIEVNRVHPDTYKSQHLPWMHKTLHRAAREAEIKNGWSHDNGLFIVRQLPDGQKFIVPNDRFRETNALKHEPYVEKLARMEAWSDEKSLIDFCKNVVSKDVIAAVTSGKAWREVHGALEKHGMRVHKAGANSYRLEAMTEAGDVVRLPISKALRSVKFAEFETLLGSFTPSSLPLRPAALANEHGRHGGTEPRLGPTTKRDPLKRELRRLERAAERTALIDRYKAEKAAVVAKRADAEKQLKAIAAEKRSRLASLKDRAANRRREILRSDASPTERQALYSVIAFDRMSESAAIGTEFDERRKAVISQRPELLSWRSWLEREAQAGDAAALSALRGLVYQERRETRTVEAKEGAEEGSDHDQAKVMASLLEHELVEDAIRSAQANRIRQRQADALMREIGGLTWRVTNNGNVEYRRASGATAFVDKGNKLTFDRKVVTDQDIDLALFHAREKWGRGIVLTGGDTVFTQRMVRAAVHAGLTVKNPELQQMQAAFAEQLAVAGSVAKNTRSAKPTPASTSGKRRR
nr:TraI/MobA(P) family conjugative relaxase [Burkholderia cenocepacia]